MTDTELDVLAEGLEFPEGPIAMPDGSVVLVEIKGGRLTKVAADGAVTTVADLGGGPNGAAIGPDGKCYVCNNGGGFVWKTDPEYGLRPHTLDGTYKGGYIERVDLATGATEVVYTDCGDIPLRGPNDLVFDRQGGFWFTDTGRRRSEDIDLGALYYATIDGGHIERVAHPINQPNGVGLSPDESRVYVSETSHGRLWAWDVVAPGRVRKRPFPSPAGGDLVAGLPGYKLFDSLALDAEGNILIATLMESGISTIAPDGRGEIGFVPLPDVFTTNICFGGPDLKTAYVTLGATGRLIRIDWPTPGLPLNFLNR